MLRAARHRLTQLFFIWPAAKVFTIRNFRLMWIGAFLSFFGSQLQLVAERYYVWDLTHREDALGWLGTINGLPGTILFPFVGLIVDLYDKRISMTVCMVLLGIGAAVLGWGVQTHTATYGMFLMVALLSGVLSTLELPTRQSIIRDVVPPEDLSKAIPMQAMTFNLARVVGPAAAGFILAHFSLVWCFYLNAVSFAALIYSPWVLKADFTPRGRANEPIKDLVLEGMIFTLRNKSLRAAFILECATALFAIFYVTQLPAYVDKVLHLRIRELGYAQSFVGVGAISGLIALGFMSEKPNKPLIIRIAATLVVLGLALLAIAKVAWLAYMSLAVVGAGTIMQFNTTNALFQSTPPVRLKGRVLTMHFWALSGLSPLGLCAFGYLAQMKGLVISLTVGSLCLGVVALWGWTRGFEIRDPIAEVEPAAV